MLTMQLAGETALEVFKQIGELATIAGGNPLDKIETEALLAELRDRLAKNGQVVKVVPFDNEKTSGEGDSPAATRRTRQKKETPTTIEQLEQVTTALDQIGQLEQTIADSVPSVPANAEVTVLAPTTIEEVKSALNAFAAVNGQVEARKVMQDVGGAPALKDVPANKYGDLVLALQNGMVKQAA